MKQVRFLSYLRTLTGVSRYKLKSNPNTVADALKEVANTFPQIKELILDDVPDVSFILGDKTLVTPKDLSLALNDELIIGPIVAGGSTREYFVNYLDFLKLKFFLVIP